MTRTNDPNLQASGAGDLLGRVRRAHSRELEGPEEAEGGEVDRPPLSDGLREAERRVASEIEGQLERGLVSTACEVVAGEIDSTDAVHTSVVDTVVESRYEHLVAGEEREALVSAVEETLTGDAAFRDEVENMLMHAARRLGQAQREQWGRPPETETDPNHDG